MKDEGLSVKGERLALGWRRPASFRPCGAASALSAKAIPTIGRANSPKGSETVVSGEGIGEKIENESNEPINHCRIKYLTLRTNPKRI